mmetsp:Transcript_1243/g.8180  ORF Transcript_1243/g.8180 Transcript_1243/m.8180 type:complete len:89 (+) Transcript_1243:111-377(+)
MNAGRGRGSRRGRGGRRVGKGTSLSAVGGAKKQARGGKKGGSKKVPDAPKPTQEDLDRQMDEYMFEDKPVRVFAEGRTGDSSFLLSID